MSSNINSVGGQPVRSGGPTEAAPSQPQGQATSRGRNPLTVLKDFFDHPPLDPAVRAELVTLAKEAYRPDAACEPWAEVTNAHSTNTPEQMKAALQGDYDWLEGDAMLEGTFRPIPGWGGREVIMAHDSTKAIYGMTLEEWLETGKLCGRGLKIDIKQAAALPMIIESVKRSGIPHEKLIFNADIVGMPLGIDRVLYTIAHVAQDRFATVKDLQKVRAEFPTATINIGLRTTPLFDRQLPLDGHQVRKLMAAARCVGPPVMFPLRAELLTREVVEKLETVGHVAVWNMPSKTALRTESDVIAEREKFLSWGVTGMIDLRSSGDAH